uniref:Uncharacterized protein n=1 Tax=Romanomermis culicivorax TaxID=13658 RepID=A0A915HR55_ROMCU
MVAPTLTLANDGTAFAPPRKPFNERLLTNVYHPKIGERSRRNTILERNLLPHAKPAEPILHHNDSILSFWSYYKAEQNLEVKLHFETSALKFSNLTNLLLRDIYTHLIKRSLKPPYIDFESYLKIFTISAYTNIGDVTDVCKELTVGWSNTNTVQFRRELTGAAYHGKMYLHNESASSQCQNITGRILIRFIDTFYSQLHADIHITGPIDNITNIGYFVESFNRVIVHHFTSKPIGKVSPNERPATTFINVTARGEVQNFVDIGYFIPRRDKLALIAINILQNAFGVIANHKLSLYDGLAYSVKQLTDSLTKENIWMTLQKYFDPNSILMKRIVIHINAEHPHVDQEVLRQFVAQ